jgi:hypothetical protein
MKRKIVSYGEAKPIRIGKDEMNLVENPIALLTDRPDPNQKTLVFTQPYTGKDGKLKEAKWLVTGSDQHGLPLAGDEDIILVLLELTKEQGFKSRTIEFSRYEIVRRLKGSLWSPSGEDYRRIQSALDRLVGVTIYADRWYDLSKRSFGAIRFHILEKVVLHDEAPGRKRLMQPPFRLSSITWDESIFRSFQNGYIKNLDLDRYFALKSPIARRLYRLLDKRFYDGKPQFEISLRLLAYENLGLSRNYEYDSHIKAKMKKAHDELVANGCISGYDFRPGREGIIVIYYPAKRSAPLLVPATEREEQSNSDLMQVLMQAGISRDVADNLSSTFSEEHIREKLSYLPYANAKNPGGWLRRAIESDWQAPAGYLRTEQEKERQQKRSETKAKVSRARKAHEEANKAKISLLESVNEEERTALRDQAEQAAREKHPQAAKTADRGKGLKVWETLIQAELERLLLDKDE